MSNKVYNTEIISVGTEILLGHILDFVSVGKTRGELEGELGVLWKKIEPIALMAKFSDTCNGCYFYTKKIMHMIRHLIPEQDQLERPSPKPENNQENQQDVDAGTGQQPPGMKSGKQKKILVMTYKPKKNDHI